MNKGFTLIELLIYSGILVVVLAFTGEYLYSIAQARLNNSARSEIGQNAQLVFKKVESDFSHLTSISQPSGIDPSNILIFDISEDILDYHLENGKITRSINSQKDNLTSNQVIVTNLSFQKITNSGGKNTLQIKFTLTSPIQLSGGRNVSEDFQTTVNQR